MGRSLDELVLQAVKGGVTVVQLREKHMSTRDFVEQARSLGELLRPLGVPLIVNDHVDVAIAADADGVHVGQGDMRAADARRLVGPDKIVGLSITTLAEAKLVDPTIVDYVGVGPVFETPTKLDAAEPLGLAGTRGVCQALSIPIVAIGGNQSRQCRRCARDRCPGIAVISGCARRAIPDAASRLFDIVRHRAFELAT